MRIIDLDGIQHGTAGPPKADPSERHVNPRTVLAGYFLKLAANVFQEYKVLGESAADRALADALTLVVASRRLEERQRRQRRFLRSLGRGLKVTFRFPGTLDATFHGPAPTPTPARRAARVRWATTRVSLSVLATSAPASPPSKPMADSAPDWVPVSKGYERLFQQLETYLLVRTLFGGVSSTAVRPLPLPDCEIEPLATACGVTRLGVALVPRAPGRPGALGHASGSQAVADHLGHQQLAAAA